MEHIIKELESQLREYMHLNQNYFNIIKKLETENARYRDVLSSIESSTFQWVMTKDNAADILLVLRPIREKCRDALKENND